MRTDELQLWLQSLGFDPGPIDGIYGQKTEDAIFDCMNKYCPPYAPPVQNIVPPDWMPSCTMARVIVHWTAGTYTANADDREHYHILIEGDGKLIRGKYTIKDNVSSADGVYAAHTRNCNSGSIGVSLCCMAGAVESPFNAGAYPMREVQFDTLAEVVANLCANYKIQVTPQTVLSHAEVQGTLGIVQAGKWDYTRLAFDPSISGAKACGDRLRAMVAAQMS